MSVTDLSMFTEKLALPEAAAWQSTTSSGRQYIASSFWLSDLVRDP
jgi:hypothetical protein